MLTKCCLCVFFKDTTPSIYIYRSNVIAPFLGVIERWHIDLLIDWKGLPKNGLEIKSLHFFRSLLAEKQTGKFEHHTFAKQSLLYAPCVRPNTVKID